MITRLIVACALVLLPNVARAQCPSDDTRLIFINGINTVSGCVPHNLHSHLDLPVLVGNPPVLNVLEERHRNQWFVCSLEGFAWRSSKHAHRSIEAVYS